MRAAAVKFNLNSVQCPFCRCRTEELSTLIVCSDCKTYYHRECWNQNQGCSVFGCKGIINDLKRKTSEPRWLSALRMAVFGFIVFSFLSLQLSQSFFASVWFFVWGLIFSLAAPLLLLIEIICLFQVSEHPEMRASYGRPLYHILSLSGYGIIIFLFFLSILLLPFVI